VREMERISADPRNLVMPGQSLREAEQAVQNWRDSGSPSDPNTAYTSVRRPDVIPGVNYAQPWRNNPTQPLPEGMKWQKVNEGSRSEGWMPVQVGAPAQTGGPFPPEPVSPPRTGGPLPPAPPVADDPGYREWRQGWHTDMRYRPKEELAARERGFYDQYIRERGGWQSGRGPTVGAPGNPLTPDQQAAENIVTSMNRTNPMTWSPQQWAEYEQAHRGRKHAATLGGPQFRRGASGQIFDHTYGGTGRPFDPNEKRFMGRAFRSDGTEIDISRTLPPIRPPSTPPQSPGQAQPIPPPSQGTLYTPPAGTPKPTPLPPPPAKKPAAKPPAPAPKSTPPGKGSSNRKFTNVNGKYKWT
jgi:hypothetical protein